MALKAVFASCQSLASWLRLDSSAIEFRDPGRSCAPRLIHVCYRRRVVHMINTAVFFIEWANA
ncbi:hypothetical protein OUZ56_012982 [Daphnia magna]|uniref:Uncharacterized protein n=1 Tax=Daphnia magna TaxID=35525 RepID=A0ABQ9Z4L1_9CRUS|nr:hypothetical protein OUZ56_012982 [Daphnia magna]